MTPQECADWLNQGEKLFRDIQEDLNPGSLFVRHPESLLSGVSVYKNNIIDDKNALKTRQGFVLSPARFVQLAASLDEIPEPDIYSYWFQKNGVNAESVDDVIAYAKMKVFGDIDRRFDAMKKIDLFFERGILIHNAQ